MTETQLQDANTAPMGVEIGVGIIGMGFMGWTHTRAYLAAQAAGVACRVVALCDREPVDVTKVDENSGNIENSNTSHAELLAHTRTTSSVDDVLNDPAIDLVSICTHTDTHVDLAARALEAGKHVLVEKPIAIRSTDAQRLAHGARQSNTLCMPAMCMRFWPAWAWLRDRTNDNAYGSVRSATFRRLGTVPAWASAFYEDQARSGGALFDLHIHDVDFITWCFGYADSVVASGSQAHVTTAFRYNNGPAHVVAEGGWDHAHGFPFQMRYTAVFDDATADFDINRDDQLLVYRDGNTEVIAVEPSSGYDGQVRHLLSCIERQRDGQSVTLGATTEQAAQVIQLLEDLQTQLGV